MLLMIRHSVHVDGTESDHTHAQYAAPTHSSCLTELIYACAGRRTDVFAVLRTV
jgi:hypothetical protein